MKKTILLAVLLFRIAISMAQTPNMFRYQAVARNASGVSIPNKTIKLRLSILEGSASGIPVYSEVRSVTTNSSGLFTVFIGSTPTGTGNGQSGSVAAVDWSNGSKFLKVEMDPNNGTQYVHMGTSQLAANPFALHAQVTDSLQLLSKVSLSSLIPGGAIKGHVLRYGTSSWSPFFLPASTFSLPFSGRPVAEAFNLTLTGDAPGMVVSGVQNSVSFSSPALRALAAIGKSASKPAVAIENTGTGAALSCSKFGNTSIHAIGAENAYALNLNGNVRMAGPGMTPVNSGVLMTSPVFDNAGNKYSTLKWANSRIGFQAKSSGAVNLGPVEVKPALPVEVFDLSNSFSSGSNPRFIAPTNGSYAFRASALVKGIQTGTLGDSPDLKNAEIQIRVLREGVVIDIYRSKEGEPGRLASYLNLKLGTNLFLKAGDVVELFIAAKAEDISPSVSEVNFSGVLQANID